MKVPGATRILQRVTESLNHAPQNGWLPGQANGKSANGSNGRHVNPRFRAFGRARLDIARRVQSQEDWDTLWKGPANPFPFTWNSSWKQSIEYRVDDFAAEVGFLIDGLGLPVVAFSPEYGIFTSPNGDFCFSVAAVSEGESSTPPEAIRIQFMLANLLEAVEELERRGVCFEQKPQPTAPGAATQVAYFRTPHGICVDLWGEVDALAAQEPAPKVDAKIGLAPQPEPTPEPPPPPAKEEFTPLDKPFELAPLDFEESEDDEIPAPVDVMPYLDEDEPDAQVEVEAETPKETARRPSNFQLHLPTAASEDSESGEDIDEEELDFSEGPEPAEEGPEYEDIEDQIQYEDLEDGDVEGEDLPL